MGDYPFIPCYLCAKKLFIEMLSKRIELPRRFRFPRELSALSK